MVNNIMYQKIQNFKNKGMTKAEVARATGLNKRTVIKYYDMAGKKYLKHVEKLRYRSRGFEPYKPHIIEVYEKNGFKELNKAAVYDMLEEKHGTLPGNERSLRGYISYLLETEQMELKKNGRIYYPVDELPYGKQLQADFGEYRTPSGLKIYIFAAVLSASRYKYCAFQDMPFTTLDVIGHFLDCFEFMGGIPEEIVIDQDKLLVVNENIGDIVYTKDFGHFKEEMGFKMYVCRKSDPESKGKIENLIGFIKQNFLSVRDFSEIGAARASMWKWLTRRANGKISQATLRIPGELIEEERRHLKPLRLSIYRKSVEGVLETRIPNERGLITVRGAKYPVPDDYRGREVGIYLTEEKLYICDSVSGDRIKEYNICLIPGGTVQDKHRPHRKEENLLELKRQFRDLFPFPGWQELVERNFEAYRRYFRDQYHAAVKISRGDTDLSSLERAIEYCLDNKTYSMSDLADTYRHFKGSPEVQKAGFRLNLEAGLRNIPAEKRGIKVEKPDIRDYKRLAAVFAKGVGA